MKYSFSEGSSGEVLTEADNLGPESTEYIDVLSGVEKSTDDDLNSPLLKAIKARDMTNASSEITKITEGGSKDAETQLMYAFFAGPMPPPRSPTDEYAATYNRIKELAEKQILRGDFGTEQKPRNPPLSKMEVAMLRAAERSPILGKDARARVIAALSAGVPPVKPSPDTRVENIDASQLLQPFLTEPQSERVAVNGLTSDFASASLKGPMALSSGQIVASNRPPLEKYTLDKVIGSGVSGTAVLGRDSKDEQVVIKKIRLDPDPKKRVAAVDAVLRESALQMFLGEKTKHAKIVCDLREVIITEDSAYVVLEACDGNLASKLAEEPLSIEDAVGMFADMAEMFGKMHDLGITHRDIKLENMLVKGDKMFISDFGLSKSHQREDADKSKDEKEEIVILDERDMEASLEDDARKFAMMMFEFLRDSKDLSSSEHQALQNLMSNFHSCPQFAKCEAYNRPNCISRLFRVTPTTFTRLVNLVGKMGVQKDPKAMANCAQALRELQRGQEHHA
jgi:Protein kinase domain